MAITIINWPSTVNRVQYAPLSKSPVDQRSSFQTDAGGPKMASLSTDQLWAVAFDMIMSGTELGIFNDWWTVNLRRGSMHFTGLEDVVTDASAVYLFVPGRMPSFSLIRSGNAAARRYRGSFSLLQFS